MKKNHSPGGYRIVLRTLLLGVTLLALVAICETFAVCDGPCSKSLGTICNEALIVSAKIGLGVSLLHDQENDRDSWISKRSRKLEEVSHKAFVSAAKVEIYAD